MARLHVFRLSRALLSASLLLPAVTLAQPPQPHGPSPRTVAVSGQGEVRAAPDRARLDAGVFVVRDSVAPAEQEVNAIVRRFVDALRKLDIEGDDLQTTGVAIQPEYRWDADAREQQLVGYRVSRDIDVTIDDLGQLGDVLSAATQSGLNLVQPPVLESSQAAALREQALVKAAQDAQGRARVLAQTLGATLGPVRSVHATQDVGMPQPEFKAMAMRSADAGGGANEDMGLSAGEIVFSVQLSAEFDLQID